MNFSAKNSQIAIILILVLGAKIQIAALFCTQYSKAVKRDIFVDLQTH